MNKQQLLNRLIKLKQASQAMISNTTFQFSLASYSPKATKAVASLSVELYRVRCVLKYKHGYRDPDFFGIL